VPSDTPEENLAVSVSPFEKCHTHREECHTHRERGRDRGRTSQSLSCVCVCVGGFGRRCFLSVFACVLLVF
jgi:hypothetical protein